MKLVEQHGPTYKAVIITRYVSSVYSADYQAEYPGTDPTDN